MPASAIHFAQYAATSCKIRVGALQYPTFSTVNVAVAVAVAVADADADAFAVAVAVAVAFVFGDVLRRFACRACVTRAHDAYRKLRAIVRTNF